MRDISFLKSCQGRKWFTAKQGSSASSVFFGWFLGQETETVTNVAGPYNPKPETLVNLNTKLHGTRVLLHTHQEEEEEPQRGRER